MRKSLYGLKESGRQWYLEVNATLLKLGLVSCPSDPCVYVLRRDEKVLILHLYVDDILIASDSQQLHDTVRTALEDAYSIKSMGAISEYLGMEFNRRANGMTITQKRYTEEVCKRFDIDALPPCKTPVATKEMLSDADAEASETIASNVPYKQAIGALLFLSGCTRTNKGASRRYAGRKGRRKQGLTPAYPDYYGRRRKRYRFTPA